MSRKKKVNQESNENLNIIEYTGLNAKQIMEFSGAFHIDVSDNQLKLWIFDCNRIPARPLVINPGQFLVKEDDKFKVID